MYKLEFTLKQHTPLIHFQHHQEGATLRATEVKPKLDKFLIENITQKKGNVAIDYFKTSTNRKIKLDNVWIDNPDFREEWLYLLTGNSNDHLALDYKIVVEESDTNWSGDVIIIPPNQDKALKKNDFRIFFKSNKIQILELIELHINDFFILHSFGKRQSKGFGCFYLSTTQISDFNIDNRAIYRMINRGFVNEGISFYDPVSKAWRELKSGSNRPYKKSRIFKYLFNHDMRWEKRWFKVSLFDLINDPTNTDSELKHQLLYTNEPLDVSDEETEESLEGYYGFDDNEECEDYNYYFGRAFLGLAEHYEFRTVRSDRIYQYKIKSSSVERFKSPVTFKVFNNNIFAIAEKVPKEIKDIDFQFDLIVKNPQSKETIRKKEDFTELPTPDAFNLISFLDDNFSFVGFNRI